MNWHDITVHLLMQLKFNSSGHDTLTQTLSLFLSLLSHPVWQSIFSYFSYLLVLHQLIHSCCVTHICCFQSVCLCSSSSVMLLGPSGVSDLSTSYTLPPLIRPLLQVTTKADQNQVCVLMEKKFFFLQIYLRHVVHGYTHMTSVA